MLGKFVSAAERSARSMLLIGLHTLISLQCASMRMCGQMSQWLRKDMLDSHDLAVVSTIVRMMFAQRLMRAGLAWSDTVYLLTIEHFVIWPLLWTALLRRGNCHSSYI